MKYSGRGALVAVRNDDALLGASLSPNAENDVLKAEICVGKARQTPRVRDWVCGHARRGYTVSLEIPASGKQFFL